MILGNKYYFFKKYCLVTLASLLIISCNYQKPYEEFQGSIFGTYYNVKFFSHAEDLIKQSDLDSIFSIFNNSLSTYINSSIISRVNKNEDVLVDELFIDVFNKSKVIFQKTAGLFDPTIGELLEYYGFGPNKEINDIDQNQILLILKSVGFDKVSIVNNKVLKQNLLTKLDFNAIAKGYAVDIIA